jgi:hypothetical protein
MYMRPTVLNVEYLFFWCEATMFWVGPINLEPNTSQRIWYRMWCCDALYCVTMLLAASGLTFRSCMPNGGISDVSAFAHTPRSWEWHATELDVMIPKKGGYGPVTCIFGVWDGGCQRPRYQGKSLIVACVFPLRHLTSARDLISPWSPLSRTRG